MTEPDNDEILNRAVQDLLNSIEAGLRDILNHVEEIPKPYEFEVYDFNPDTKKFEGVVNCPQEVQYFFEYEPKTEMITYGKLTEPMYLEDFLTEEDDEDQEDEKVKNNLNDPQFVFLGLVLAVFWNYLLYLVSQVLSDLLT